MREKGVSSAIVIVIVIIIAAAGVGGYFLLKGEGEEGEENEAGEEGVPAPTEFEVSNLTLDPSEVEAGEPVEISATVKNVGDLEGTYTVELKIDGEIQETRDVTLVGGATETVSFTVTKETSGTYTIGINGLQRVISISHQPEWECIGVYTACTDYWRSTQELFSEPWNRTRNYTIYYYYSTNEQSTGDFYIQGNKFKLHYYMAGDYEDGMAMIFTYPKGEDIYYVSARPVYTPYTQKEGTYEVNEGPGYYYCVIDSEYIDFWSIAIWDWR